MVEVLFENESEYIPQENLLTMLKNVMEKSLEMEKFKLDVEISLTFTTNEVIKELNEKHRNIDKATDVLSFPMYEAKEILLMIGEKINTPVVLGDIVVSVEKAKVQAKEYGHSFERELAYMVVHGFYHLMGYDHIELVDRTEMREKEETILKKLNITRGDE